MTLDGSDSLDGSGTVSITGCEARGELTSKQVLEKIEKLDIFAAWCDFEVA